MLKPGQVIRTGGALYRVDYVNTSRARIVPLAKRHVTLGDGREFDAERQGVNISPNAFVEVVDNIETARAAIELEEALAEVRAAERELAVASIPIAPARLAKTGRTGPTSVQASSTQGALSPTGRAPRTSGGWHAVPDKIPEFKDGSLAQSVIDYILVHPGLTTAEIVAGVQAEGAVAACVSRFNQAGIIKKS